MSDLATSTSRPERSSRPVTAITNSVSQPVLDNTPYWQRVDRVYDSQARAVDRDRPADVERDVLFEQADWLEDLGEDLLDQLISNP